jgi:hypothetical protein
LIAVTPNAKSSTLGSLSRRVLGELARLASVVCNFAEDVEVRNALRPRRSIIAGTNFSQNSAFTWRPYRS